MAYDPLQVCAMYRATFVARTDVYSQWTPDGWRPVRSELTPEVIYAALTRQASSLSGYFPGPDNRTHVAALDLDLDDGLALGQRIAFRMRADGVPAYVEPSRRGSHLWVVIDLPLSARVVRRALWTWMSEADVARDPKIEMRPVADSLEGDSIGMCLRLPLMPHPVTGQQFRLAAPDGTVLGTRVSEVLLAIDVAPAAKFTAAAERYVPVLDPRLLTPRDRPPRPPGAANAVDESISDILRDLWGVPNAVPGRSVRCPAHDDRSPSLSILPDDRRVICHAPACDLHNDGHGVGTYQLRKIWFSRRPAGLTG